MEKHDTNKPTKAPIDQIEGFQAKDVEPSTTATMSNIWKFLNVVKEHCKGDTPRFTEFLTLVNSLKQTASDKIDAITQIKELFKDYNEVLLHFDELVLSLEDKKILPSTNNVPREYQKLIDVFLEKLKPRVVEGMDYDFLINEQMFESRSGVTCVREEFQSDNLALLLKDNEDNSDLLEDFALVVRSQPGQIMPTLTPTTSKKHIVNDQGYQPRGSNAIIKATLQQFLNGVEEYFKDDTSMFEEFATLLKRRKEGTLDNMDVFTKTKELFKDHKEMLVRFNELLPPQNKIIIPPTNLSEDYPQLVGAFLEKLKSRCNNDKYYNFLIHRLFKSQSGILHVRESSLAIVEKVFHDGLDLLEDFALVVRSQPTQITPPHIPRLSVNEMNIEYEPHAMRTSIDRIATNHNKETDIPTNMLNKPRDSNQLNPSYDNIEQPFQGPTRRSALANSVLNEEFKLRSFGEPGFKTRFYNKHEATVFKCSDELDELDMQIERHALMGERLQEYLKLLDDGDMEDDVPPLQRFLSAVDIRVFRDLYQGSDGDAHNEQAKAMVEEVSANPCEEVPKVVNMVFSKEKKLRKQRKAKSKALTKVLRFKRS